ncbi:MAG: SDR family NAD(P)-dependent oxidoreductase [Halobacteriota archaeon]
MDTVVVTGASRGIGASVAHAFAAEGAHVVCCAREYDAVDAVATDIVEAGGSAAAYRADVRDEFDMERLMEQAARFSGAVDVLIASAGVIHGKPGEMSLAAESYSAFDDTLRTNVRGVFTAVKEALPHMPNDGRILVPSSTAVLGGPPGMGAYAASKAAAEALVHGFAADVEQAVCVVDPGRVATELTDGRGRSAADVAPMFVWAARETESTDGGRLDIRAWKRAIR